MRALYRLFSGGNATANAACRAPVSHREQWRLGLTALPDRRSIRPLESRRSRTFERSRRETARRFGRSLAQTGRHCRASVLQLSADA